MIIYITEIGQKVYICQVDDCVFYRCPAPPTPTDLGIVPLRSADPREFGENVTYVCESSDLFFADDRTKTAFNITCLATGLYETPSPWPKCVDSEWNIIVSAK